MIDASKKISPQALNQLKDSLSVIYWKKDELRDFLKMVLTQNTILSTLDWSAYKREVVNELIRRMVDRLDIFQQDLLNLFHAVADFDNYDHLKFWDDDGSKTSKAKDSVAKLRKLTKGYFQLTKEQEQSAQRKVEREKTIQKTLSLEDELLQLKQRFEEIALCKNYQKRGYLLEKFLYDLFLLHDLEPKEGYRNNGEQIDGAFTFQHADYLLEAKWSKEVDRNDLADFCHKVDTKLKSALGLLVSIDGVTKHAIDPYFKSIIIMDGFDIMSVLDCRITLSDLLFKKRRKAIETGQIYLNINQL